MVTNTKKGRKIRRKVRSLCWDEEISSEPQRRFFHRRHFLHRGGVSIKLDLLLTASLAPPAPPPPRLLNTVSRDVIAHWFELCIYYDIFRFLFLLLHFKKKNVIRSFFFPPAIYAGLNTALHRRQHIKGCFWQMRMKTLQVRDKRKRK